MVFPRHPAILYLHYMFLLMQRQFAASNKNRQDKLTKDNTHHHTLRSFTMNLPRDIDRSTAVFGTRQNALLPRRKAPCRMRKLRMLFQFFRCKRPIMPPTLSIDSRLKTCSSFWFFFAIFLIITSQVDPDLRSGCRTLFASVHFDAWRPPGCLRPKVVLYSFILPLSSLSLQHVHGEFYWMYV